MSIARDLRSYADNAVTQSKQVIDQAQTQLNDVTGQANVFYGKTRENIAELAEKATSAVNDLRTSAEKAVNLNAIKTAVEPYLAQVREYGATVTDRAETLLSGVRNDKRVAPLVDAAGVVVEAVQERVVKPVQELTRRDAKPAPAAEPEPASATEPKPAAAAAAEPATKAAAAKPAGEPSIKPAIRKAPARPASR